MKTEANVNRILRSRNLHRHWVVMVVLLAVLVITGTFYTLKNNATAQTYQKRVLECPCESGTVSHIHNDDCYLNGDLVCLLEAIEPHEHSEACLESVLSCGLQENPGHVHGPECYTGEKALICEEDHEHTDECYTVLKTLSCGREEGEGDE